MNDCLSLHFSLPPARLIQFPSIHHTSIIRPSDAERSWTRPFNISAEVYDYPLHIAFPILFASSYVLIIAYLNSINRKRCHKPWRLTQTRSFHYLVLFHNIGLAVFSAWVFCGLLSTVYRNLPSIKREAYSVHVAATLCHIEGRYILHNSVLNATRIVWDTGYGDGLWQRGLGYFCWVMYMSKYYEVMDTVILILKGKEITFLQTYHHSGVMIGSWALMRSISPHCLVAALLNSGVHALMYLYYALQTLKIPVPMHLKRTLTAVQIAQFSIGYILGLCYLFIAYNSPHARISTGRDDVLNDELRHTVVPCLHTPGHLAVLLLGGLYLGPLIYLFVRFFVRSYLSAAKGKMD
ncbi:hypothetical protein AnigIFM63326_010909 [Aspergillus niger]|nr:hypothetical protein ANI_1_3304014 [Aspergillus niger CBS 513.88]GLA31992.1 hypothetical protein AnigIFM63326_010909 [Aspergillus niger]|eukprot:XP_001389790.2 hypothetical protein ANI_1_3304014 [Aspergillus niger CBS 513.88]